MKRAWIDATRPLASGAPVYPGDLPIRVESLSRIAAGGAFDLSALHCSCHAQTHIDAPSHFIAGGASVDLIDPARLVCPALVVAVARQIVEPSDLPRESLEGEAILFKTRPDGAAPSNKYDTNHAWLSEACARELAARGAGAVGIDAPDVDRHGDALFPAHHALLGAGIPIIENLNLDGVEPGRYAMLALPLKIEGAEAAPARVLLSPEAAGGAAP